LILTSGFCTDFTGKRGRTIGHGLVDVNIFLKALLQVSNAFFLKIFICHAGAEKRTYYNTYIQ